MLSHGPRQRARLPSLGFRGPQALTSAARHPSSAPRSPPPIHRLPDHLSSPTSPPTQASSLGAQPLLPTPILHLNLTVSFSAHSSMAPQSAQNTHKRQSLFHQRRPHVSREAPRKPSRRLITTTRMITHQPPPTSPVPPPLPLSARFLSLRPPSPKPFVYWGSPSSLRSQLNQRLLQEAFLTSEAALGAVCPVINSPHTYRR